MSAVNDQLEACFSGIRVLKVYNRTGHQRVRFSGSPRSNSMVTSSFLAFAVVCFTWPASCRLWAWSPNQRDLQIPRILRSRGAGLLMLSTGRVTGSRTC
jgi:hypothetical protein